MLTIETSRGPLDFELPASLEAHEPPESRGLARDGVRLLVSHMEDDSLEHRRFVDLPDILWPGDLLVANDSGTLPAALTGRRADGSLIALHVSTRLPGGLWVVEPRHVRSAEGDVLELAHGETVRLLAPYAESRRLWVAQFSGDVYQVLARSGRPISYPYVRGQWPLAMYQTVYAGPVGSAEMP